MPRWFLAAWLVGAICIAQTGADARPAPSAVTAESELILLEKIDRAKQLYNAGNFVAALPLFEEAVKAKPDDPQLNEGLGFCLLASTPSIQDPELRKATRVRGRQILQRAEELIKKTGGKSELVKIWRDIPEDGSESSYSSNTTADQWVKKGEEAFVQAKYEEAIGYYKKALEVDPNNYHAALFIGDVLYKQKKYEQSFGWFEQATRIAPDKETAYRYWGDALYRSGDWRAAREKFIEAIVAEPYDRRPWMGLRQWAEARKKNLSHPAFNIPKVDDKGNTNIVLDINSLGKGDGGFGWIGYTALRMRWRDTLFKERFPQEKVYRHSLFEEVDALRAAVKASLSKQLSGEMKRLDEIDKQGLLEAFVLLALPDEGIAQDYAAYRAKNRDKLRQYIDVYVISK